MRILDCHTHRPAPYPEGIVSVAPDDWAPLPGQLYSVGLHPWFLPDDLDAAVRKLGLLARDRQVAAIGEAGLDALRGAPMYRQMQAFHAQARIAQVACKPLIVHNVRCTAEIALLRRQWGVTVPWIIHGFRGKATLLRMLLDAGCHISCGSRLNTAVLPSVPLPRLLAETDDSPQTISEVISAMAGALGMEPGKLADRIAETATEIFYV